MRVGSAVFCLSSPDIWTLIIRRRRRCLFYLPCECRTPRNNCSFQLFFVVCHVISISDYIGGQLGLLSLFWQPSKKVALKIAGLLAT